MDKRQEFSAGGVVYKRFPNDGLVFLLGKHSGYHKWVLPKGMIEAGETPEETAVRETQEELAVAARIVDPQAIHMERYSYMADYKDTKQSQGEGSTRRVTTYQEAGGGTTQVDKTVTFYLMEYVSGDSNEHGWEMEDAGWFSYEEALEKMSFEGEKIALEKAYQKLTA